MPKLLNSLSPGRSGYTFKCVDYTTTCGIDILSAHANIILEGMPEVTVYGKSVATIGVNLALCVYTWLDNLLIHIALNPSKAHIFLTENLHLITSLWRILPRIQVNSLHVELL